MASTSTDTRPPLLANYGNTATVAAPRYLSSRVWVAITLAAIVLGAAILFFFDPHHGSIYPVCIFHRFTGLNCPGCGSLRALNDLLHGHVIAALHSNALLTLTLPFVAWLAARFLIRSWRNRTMADVNISTVSLWIWLAAMVVFAVLRNFPAFSWLAP